MIWDIGKIINKRAMLTPKKIALIYEDTPITYKELNAETNRVAHYLQEKGLKKGDRISVNLLNCPEFLAIYFAAAKLGLVFVPLNYRNVASELEYQMNDCGSRLLLFNDVFAKNIESIRFSMKVEEDKFVYLKSGVPDNPECPGWAVDYHELIKNHSTDEPETDCHIKADDPLAIIYSSCVTGNSTGAVLSHGQTYFKNFQLMMYTDMRNDDIFLSQLPLYRSGGLFVSATPVLCRGATLIMRQNFRPEQFARDIGKHRSTIIFALTTMWGSVLQTKALDDVDVSSVRIVIGEGVKKTPLSLVRELAKKGLYMQSGFGQTENSAMMILPKEDIQRKEGSVGLPGFFTEVWIENERGEKVGPGEIGEIVATGPTVMSGYWSMPGKTAETFIDGVLHTGALGYMDEEGYFYIVERANDMYRSGEENIYPSEIEKFLAKHPKIEDVAIIGVPDEKWGETGKAIIVIKDGETLTRKEVFNFLQGKVARFKFPVLIEFVDALPLTPTGKIRKTILKESCLTI